jgi:hypothetical protein
LTGLGGLLVARLTRELSCLPQVRATLAAERQQWGRAAEADRHAKRRRMERLVRQLRATLRGCTGRARGPPTHGNHAHVIRGALTTGLAWCCATQLRAEADHAAKRTRMLQDIIADRVRIPLARKRATRRCIQGARGTARLGTALPYRVDRGWTVTHRAGQLQAPTPVAHAGGTAVAGTKLRRAEADHAAERTRMLQDSIADRVRIPLARKRAPRRCIRGARGTARLGTALPYRVDRGWTVTHRAGQLQAPTPVADAGGTPVRASAAASAAASPPAAVAAPGRREEREYTTTLGTFKWFRDLEKADGDIPVGDPCASAPWPRHRCWLPGGNRVCHVFAVKYDGGNKAVVFLCKLRGYQLDIRRHWYRGIITEGGPARPQGWMTDPSGPAAHAPSALVVFLRGNPDAATSLRCLLTAKQARHKSGGPLATGAPATASEHGTAADRQQVRAHPRAAAATARATLRSLAVYEAAHKHPLLAASIRAQATAAARREVAHPLVAIRRACKATAPAAQSPAPPATSAQLRMDALSTDSWSTA